MILHPPKRIGNREYPGLANFATVDREWLEDEACR
jgi:hypothetical protein